MKNFLKRTITGLIFVIILLGAILIHPLVSAALFAVIAVMTYLELASFFKKNDQAPGKVSGIFLGLLMYALILLVTRIQIDPLWLLLLLPAVLFVSLINLFRKSEMAVLRTSFTLTGTAYVFLPFALTNVLLNPEFIKDGFHPEILVGILIIIWVNDVFAYLGGSIYGRNQLIGEISPNKTWEGTITGILFSVLAGYLLSIYWKFEPVNGIIIGLLIALFGIAGDLSESVIKRSFGIKDSGKILPGHGGLLDRFDAFLFSVPVASVYIILAIG